MDEKQSTQIFSFMKYLNSEKEYKCHFLNDSFNASDSGSEGRENSLYMQRQN